MEETRTVLSRINVNFFCEELSSSERMVRLVETVVIQTRSSEDRKSLNVEQTHERTGRSVATFNTADAKDRSRVRVLLMKAILSTLKMKNFVKEWKNSLLIMTRVMSQ